MAPGSAAPAALALITAPAAFGASSDPPRSAGWHGREIRDPLPQRVRDAVRFPRGWSAGASAAAAVTPAANGSQRVREVQRRLVRRGYRPGPVDGRFGARTRAAVLWFQTKHGLPRTGHLDAVSVATLRQTADRAARRRPRGRQPGQRRAAGSRSAGAHVTAGDQHGLPADAGALGADDPARSRRDRVVGASGAAQTPGAARRQQRARLTAVTPPPAHAPVDVIGYVSVARSADRDRALETGAQIVGSWCEGRGSAAHADGARRRAGEWTDHRPARAGLRARSDRRQPGRGSRARAPRRPDALGDRARQGVAVGWTGPRPS